MHRKFLIWWLVVVTQLIGIGLLIYFDGIKFIMDNDFTRLSFVIFAMWIISTISIGLKSYNHNGDYDTPWFIAESCMTVGMIGTVIGFIIMLGSSFSEIDAGKVESMRQVIIELALGMSTALLTTLCGLVASLFIKIQVVMQEQDDV